MTGRGGQRDYTTSGSGRHVPVLLAQVLKALAVNDDETYLDGTFGAGGYTRAILETAECKVLAVDRDITAISGGQALVSQFSGRLSLLQGRFSSMKEIAQSDGISGLDGIVLDLGVSSMQLDHAERGFSFMRDGPLDMRMGQDGETAGDILARLSEKDLSNIFWKLGEERRSRAIAKVIVAEREKEPLIRTAQLAKIVERVLGRRPDDAKHPATRVFQALRLFINRELEELVDGLHAAEQVLKPGGRLVVVTFHSLEDRIVKRFFHLKGARKPRPSRHFPGHIDEEKEPCFELINHKAVKPKESEVLANPRARSAQLRAGIRTKAPAFRLDAKALGLPQIG